MPRVKLADSSRVSFADALTLLSVAREDYSLEDDTLWMGFPLVVAGSVNSYEAQFYITAAEDPDQLDVIYNQQGVDAYYESASVGSYGIQVHSMVSGEDKLLVAEDMIFTSQNALASAWHIFAVLVTTTYTSEEDLLQRCRRWGLNIITAAGASGSTSEVTDAAGYTPTPIEELLSNLLSLSLPQAAVDMIAKYQAQYGRGRTLYNSQGKELMTFAGTNSDPDTITQYSYKQHAWQRIMDSDETVGVHSLRSVLEKVLSAVKDADRRPYAAATRILLYLQQRGIEGRILDKDGIPVVIDCGGAKVSIYNTDGDGLLSIQCGGSERYFDLFAVVAWVGYLEQCLHEKKEVMDSSSDRREFIFPADSKDVTDGKGHFPIPDIAHGRNAIARVNQYSELPKWYKGKMSLQEFVKFVVDKVEKKFPSIDVSAAAKVAKPQEVKDSDDWDEDAWDGDEEETPITCTTTTAYARKFADMLDDRRYDYTASASNVFVVSPSERFRPDGIEASLHYDMTQYGIPESEVEFEVMDMDSAPAKGSKSMGMSKSKVADATSVADVIAAVKKNQSGRIMSHGNIGGIGITVDPVSHGSFRVSIANRGNSVTQGLKKAAESLGMQVDKDPDADDFMSTTVLFVPKDQA